MMQPVIRRALIDRWKNQPKIQLYRSNIHNICIFPGIGNPGTNRPINNQWMFFWQSISKNTYFCM
jgi:hypothetical protein